MRNNFTRDSLLRIFCAALSVLLLSGEFSESFAEKFRVFYAFDKVENTSRLAEREDIDVDLANITDEKEKIDKIAQKVMLEELEKSGANGYSKIDFSLQSIQNKDGVWYVIYKWFYVSELSESRESPMRFFRAKVDLKNKTVFHERTKDVQHTVSSNSI
jgi:hypothetical protein